MSVLLFAYGTNMASAEMSDWCPAAHFLGPARLDGHRLELRRRSIRWRGGAADIVRAPDSVWGALYEVPEDALDRLDSKEGEGFAYQRRAVDVLLDGERREALAYEVIDKEPAEVPCTAEYAELLLGGARERDLPDAYVEALRLRLPVSVQRP